MTTLPLNNWEIQTRKEGQHPLRTMLLSRGLIQNENELKNFLKSPIQDLANPNDFPNIIKAAQKISHAIDNSIPITIYGDYDCDGITATACLTNILRKEGANVTPFIPNRQDGYGLTEASINKAIALNPNAKLLITVDCGLGSPDKLIHFQNAGYDIIVTDHHTPGPPLPPNVLGIYTLAPNVPSHLQNLCGAGVAYFLAYALILHRHPAPSRTHRDLLKLWLGPIALATVADVVPLLGQNRIIVKNGLEILNKTPILGLKTLIKTVFPTTIPTLKSYHLGFILGPHINAAGRLHDATLALSLLLTQDETIAQKLAKELHNLSEKRKTEEHRIIKEAEHMMQDTTIFDPQKDAALVLASHDWHPGIIGLVAGKLCQQINRPTIILSIANEEARGSARSPNGFCNLYSALSDNSTLLTSYGGHKEAAGLTLPFPNIQPFRKQFSQSCLAQTGQTYAVPTLHIDGIITEADLTPKFLQGIEAIEPYGQSNPAPIWLLPHITLTPRIVGKEGTHLSLLITLPSGATIKAIWFSHSHLLPTLTSHPYWDLAVELYENTYQSQTTIELRICDARPS